MNVTLFTIIVALGTLLINNPYIMATIFVFVLFMAVFIIGRLRKFISIVLFLVYVGGIMILISYCVIILPTTKFKGLPVAYLSVTFLLSVADGSPNMPNTFCYGLLYRSRTVFLVAILLYLVILAIVEIVNYSNGMIKI